MPHLSPATSWRRSHPASAELHRLARHHAAVASQKLPKVKAAKAVQLDLPFYLPTQNKPKGHRP
jgi:hypothetical protein